MLCDVTRRSKMCLTYINGGVFDFFIRTFVVWQIVRLSSEFAAENSLAEIQKGKVLS